MFFYRPWTTLKASSIEKVVEPDIPPSSSMACEAFNLSLEQFNQGLNEATAIWEMNLHDYTWLPCYFKATIDGKEYLLRAGGLAEIWTTDGKLKYLHWTEK